MGVDQTYWWVALILEACTENSQPWCPLPLSLPPPPSPLHPLPPPHSHVSKLLSTIELDGDTIFYVALLDMHQCHSSY